MGSPLTVDADGHVLEPESMWPQYLEKRYHSLAPMRVQDDEGRSVTMLEGQFTPVALQVPPEAARQQRYPAGGFDPQARVKDLDEEGIDIAVLYPTTALRLPGVKDLGLAAALCRAYNDWLADFCRTAPKRLIGAAAVPLQDVDAAIAEAQRAVGKLGFRAIFIRPNPVNDRNMFHPAYEPFWAAVQELNVPVAIHEGTTMNVPTAGADRFENHWFRHMISHPHEMQIACMSLIGGGVLERYPELRIVFLESGSGWLPHWLERMDEHVESFHWLVRGLTMKPSEYFNRQGFISADPLERTVPATIDLLGDDVVTWATDYPHPDGMFPGAARAVRERTDIPEESKIKILGENAVRLYGLNAS